MKGASELILFWVQEAQLLLGPVVTCPKRCSIDKKMFCQNPNYNIISSSKSSSLVLEKGYKFSFLRRGEKTSTKIYQSFQTDMRMSLALVSSIKWKKRSSKKMRRRSRSRGRQKGEGFEIPLDLQIEILSRLPAKSLMRFKCVSKLWSLLIRSRYLSNRYLTVPRPPRLLMSLVEVSHECGSMEVCPSPEKSLLLSLLSSSSSSDKDPMNMPGIGGHRMVVLRGLILYVLCRKACIFNPSTTQVVTLPAVESKVQEEDYLNAFYYLGHDPVLDQYKVVFTGVVCSKDLEQVKSTEHWVYLLEAGGTWKRIEFDQPHFPTRPGLCINGVIYYLAASASYPASLSDDRDIVFSFDVRHEKFDRIQVPQEVSEFGEFIGFIEYAGKPAIFDHTHLVDMGRVYLWVLEHSGIWSKKSLVLRPDQMHLVRQGLIVAGTTQNDEVILAPAWGISGGFILYYDLQRNDLREFYIGGVWDQELSNEKCTYFNLMDKGESIIHLET